MGPVILMGMKASKLDFMLTVDPKSPLSLQQQVRQRIIDAISHGTLRPGRRLPASRQLSRQARVSRNTITLAYDSLLAEGHLQSRPRSGIYVSPNVQFERVTTGRRGLRHASNIEPGTDASGEDEGFRVPPNWLQYPYPFVDGCIEPELLSVTGWREALRLASSRQELLRWGTGAGEPDDARLIDELRTKVLPSWGLDAASDELLATASGQQALHLAIATLVERSTPVLADAVLDGAVQRQLRARGVIAQPLHWDGAAPRLATPLPRDSIVLVGWRRAGPGSIRSRERTEALLKAAAASQAIVVERLPAPELHEPGNAAVPLRSLDRSPRVVSVGNLAAVAALGTAPGVIHADARLIARMRRLRREMGAEFSAGMQRAWVYYIGLGHYAAALARASGRLLERRTALRDALNHYLHRFVSIKSLPGSSAYWVSGGPQWNSVHLAQAAARVGVLIEPIAEAGTSSQFCMGVTSIASARIREGVQELARIIRADPQLGSRTLSDETIAPLAGRALKRALSGATLLYNTVYGEPCTLQLEADGTLSGRAGYSNEDVDTGRWWVEGDRWFRQWKNWAYGESMGLRTVVDGEQVRWFSAEGLLIDTAVIVRARGARR
jgi:GntR family transcriptional regulator/MocR family aminotransferase